MFYTVYIFLSPSVCACGKWVCTSDLCRVDADGLKAKEEEIFSYDDMDNLIDD